MTKSDAERIKLLLDSFGKILPQMTAAIWEKNADILREQERAYERACMEAFTERFMTGQAFGL